MDAGLYPPDCVTRRVTRERALLLGGQRALLMQLAHPLVAAGVADHSAFPADPLQRLSRTLDATLTIVFAPEREALRAAERVNAVHARVHGTLREASGRFEAGTPYDARDPSLAMWVHATLVDSALVSYERFVAPLSSGEREAFWQESKIAAELLGVPAAHLPVSHGDFAAYVAEMLSSDDIAVADFQARLGREVLRPRVWRMPRGLFAPAEALTIDLLPPPLLDAYRLRATPRGAALSRAVTRSVRAAVPVLPASVRFVPQSRRVAWPVAAASR